VLAAAEGGLLAPLLQHLHPAHLTLVSAECQQALSVMSEFMRAALSQHHNHKHDSLKNQCCESAFVSIRIRIQEFGDPRLKKIF
jgi:hypothetical protein